jgi:hypothetical protein
MSMSVASDRQWVPAVNHDVSPRVADEKERHWDLDAAEPERAAVEQKELNAARHRAIL